MHGVSEEPNQEVLSDHQRGSKYQGNVRARFQELLSNLGSQNRIYRCAGNVQYTAMVDFSLQPTVYRANLNKWVRQTHCSTKAPSKMNEHWMLASMVTILSVFVFLLCFNKVASGIHWMKSWLATNWMWTSITTLSGFISVNV